MQQVLRSTHDADWSQLKQRLGNNLMVGDWIKCEGGEAVVKSWEDMQQEGIVGKSQTPS